MSLSMLTIINFPPLHIKKLTNKNPSTLNYLSECLFQYKTSIINNLLTRAYLIFSSPTIFQQEINNIKQTLVNNYFLNILSINRSQNLTPLIRIR